MKRRKRILFAAVDIGFRIEHYSKFISTNYSDFLIAESFSKYVLPEKHYKTEYTYTCPINKTHPIKLYLYCLMFFIFSLFRYDVFHFFSGETILTRKLRRFEFSIYKLFGKRIVMHFVGSDIRNPNYIYWKEKNIKNFLLGMNNYPKTLPWQDKLINDSVKYADYILVSTPDLLELVPSAEYYPVLIDIEKHLKEIKNVSTSVKKEDEIVILHCPSNIQIKGTAYIHEELKRIASSNKKIKLILPAEEIMLNPKIYSVSRYDLFNLYKEADIVIDQLIIGWYGLQSIEALASGNQVICYIEDPLKTYLFPDCPIVLADVNTFEDCVKETIKKIEENRPINNDNNINWIYKYHSIECNNATLLRAWNITHVSKQ